MNIATINLKNKSHHYFFVKTLVFRLIIFIIDTISSTSKSIIFLKISFYIIRHIQSIVSTYTQN